MNKKPKPIKPIKNLWVVVEPNGKPLYDTLRKKRPECIKAFDEEHTQSLWSYEDWKDARKHGCRCVRVNITFEERLKP